ncbi:MAG: mechanosensitive ion channel family protein [Xenococcaceae cyanobacterium]
MVKNLDQVITYLNSRLTAGTRLLLIALLTFTLTLTWMPVTVGQIPFFSTPSNNTITETPGWDLNKAKHCGKFWCSNVYFYRFSKTEPLSADLTLALLPTENQSGLEVAEAVEQRAKLVQRIVRDIFRDLIRWKTIAEVPVVEDWKFWLPTRVKSLHPWTPKIEVGIQNAQTVVYVPAQPELGLAPQTIVTVTGFDAKANGTTKEELAQSWRTNIHLSLSSALWGYELDVQHPWWRWGLGGAIAAAALVLIWIINGIQWLLGLWLRKLKGQIAQLTDSLAVDPEAVSAEKIDAIAAPDAPTPRETDTPPPSEAMVSEPDDSPSMPVGLKSDVPPQANPSTQRSFSNLIERIAGLQKALSARWQASQQMLPKVALQRQTLIVQQGNFIQLFQRMLFLAQILIFFFGLGLIVYLFAQTRFLFNLLFTKAVYVLGLWIVLAFADKILDFVIDYALNRWATQAQEANPTSNRYTLRVNTYSLTLKRTTTFLSMVLGIYLTVWIIGINPAVLAGAGAVALVLAFLSQNLFQDMLNGFLILSTDRYAIGDVIEVNGMGGVVEDINVYTTSLRNLDGQLIVIPNSKISTVINSSKDWSRVNFAIKVAWDADLKKTLEIIQQVMEQLQNDPQLQEKILEPGEILGIDDVSHEGILIRLLFKTQPLQQWLVGRQFRLRLKQAFDAAGISLGVPQREIWHHHENRNKLTGELSEEVL